MIDGHAFPFELEDDHEDAETLPSPFETYTRTELIELLKNREVRRLYINEFMQGDYEVLMSWIEATNTKKRKSAQKEREPKP